MVSVCIKIRGDTLLRSGIFDAGELRVAYIIAWSLQNQALLCNIDMVDDVQAQVLLL